MTGSDSARWWRLRDTCCIADTNDESCELRKLGCVAGGNPAAASFLAVSSSAMGVLQTNQ